MLSTRMKIGLALAAVLGLVDVAGLFSPTPDGEEGPPYEILLICGALGVLTLSAVVAAWRTGSRTAARVVAGSRIVSALLALPAFFVDIPTALLVLVSVSVVLTAVSVVLVLAPAERRVPVTD